MVEDKMRTDVSILYGVTGASVTPENRIPIQKCNIKSPAVSHPRNYSIPNQCINRLIIKKETIVSLNLEKCPPGYKPLLNYAHD